MAKSNFRDKILKARKLMDKGSYREAFDHIVNEEAENVKDLFNKIWCLVDSGFVLRDEKILKYAIYLLEKHREEIAIVPEYAPFLYLNLANQYSNMVTLYSYNDDYWSWFRESEMDRAKYCYLQALELSEKLPNSVKSEIHRNLALTLSNMGRWFEALEQLQNGIELSDESVEDLNIKTKLMLRLSPFNIENCNILQREAYNMICKRLEDDEDAALVSELSDRMKIIERNQKKDFLEDSYIYPSHSVETDGELEHFFISFCIRKKLYLNSCCFCNKCDWSIGDRAVFDSRRIKLSGGGEGKYYKVVSGFNRLKERYLAARFLLVRASFKEDSLEYAEMFAPRASLKDFVSMSIGETLLETAFINGWEIINSMGPILSLFLGGDGDQSLEELFFSSDSNTPDIDQKFRKESSLHAFYNIYYDLTRGNYQHLLHIARNLRMAYSDKLALNSYKAKSLEEETVVLFRNIRNLLFYLMMLLDKKENEEENQFDFPLHSFFIPEELKYN